VTGATAQPLRDPEHVRHVVAEACFPFELPEPRGSGPGRVGLEIEAFPIHLPAVGTSTGRVPIDRLVQLLDELTTGPFASRRTLPGSPGYLLTSGSSLSFEPGGQLEHSTLPHPSPAASLDEVEDVSRAVAAHLGRHRVALVSTGFDLWHHHVPQQLTAPRYQAMAAYFTRRGPQGAAMMTQTCAFQVNLDLGHPGERDERWLVANLVAPVACATFASSPGPGAVSARARTWQRLDPTRTGFPTPLVDGSSVDPVDQLTQAALAADVLLVRRTNATWEPGRPGWTFGDWLWHGHPRHGRPSVDDLRYHLTTLFLEVRPRGFLELRAIDALPARWRPVPVTLLAGLLEDPAARGQTRALLERHRSRLPRLWLRAATAGVADPELCALAVETWSLALAGAGRLPAGYLRPTDLRLAEAFLDRLTLRGRCPADELREALTRGPSEGLAWAAEPAEHAPSTSTRSR